MKNLLNQRRLTRRQLLGLGIGGAQLALLHRMGLLEGTAHAQLRSGAPSRLLTLYLSGGYSPQYMWGGLTHEQVPNYIPPVQGAGVGESAFYKPEDLIDVGQGGQGYAPLRMVKTWDEQNPGSRQSVDGRKFLPLGYSWLEHDLVNQTTVVHGIDQGTAAHASGYVSAMCGVAGGEYRSPAMQCVVANALFASTKDFRPLPCVALDSRGMPAPLSLPSASAPIYMPNLNAIKDTLSDKSATWWKGLNQRTLSEHKNWAGEIEDNINQTALERSVLEATRAQRGRSQSTGTEAHLKALYDGFSDVSKVLARDVVEILTNTPGVEHLIDKPLFGGETPYSMGPWGYTYGLADENVTSGQFQDVFDMTLRLFKADLTSSVHLYMPELYYDTHSGQSGHRRNFLDTRGGHDIIARFLGEMKRTMLSDGRSLLDDTLVVIFSEFARTWAHGSGDNFNYTDDHWPYTTVTFAGGGVAGGRTIGGYDFERFATGPRGLPVSITEEGGEKSMRPPRSADIVATVCSIMGLPLHDFFIPGGYGEIMGVRAT